MENNVMLTREFKKKKNSKKQFYNNILINDSNLCYHLFLQNLNVH